LPDLGHQALAEAAMLFAGNPAESFRLVDAARRGEMALRPEDNLPVALLPGKLDTGLREPAPEPLPARMASTTRWRPDSGRPPSISPTSARVRWSSWLKRIRQSIRPWRHGAARVADSPAPGPGLTARNGVYAVSRAAIGKKERLQNGG